jgi:hypothetical protein
MLLLATCLHPLASGFMVFIELATRFLAWTRSGMCTASSEFAGRHWPLAGADSAMDWWWLYWRL